MTSTARLSLVRRYLLGDSALAQAFWVVAFATATAAGARLEIPHEPVPYTLQTLVVLLAGAFLGPVNGAASQILYLASGLLGAPVFAGGTFGLARLLGPTGGYLLAFPLAAAVVGLIVEHRQTLVRSFLAMAAGLLVIFTSGAMFLYATYLHSLPTALNAGLLIFSWWDMLKLAAAAIIFSVSAQRRMKQ
jgi:biotin transport system substrate-specific component